MYKKKNLNYVNDTGKRVYFFYGILIILTFFVSFFIPNSNILFNVEKVDNNLSRWYYYDLNNSKKYIDKFPFFIDVSDIKVEKDVISFYRDYQKDDFIKYIAFDSNKMISKIYLEDECFFENTIHSTLKIDSNNLLSLLINNENFTRSYTGARLPLDSNGKTIRVDIDDFKTFKNIEIQKILEGTKASVIFYILNSNVFDIMFVVLFLSIAVVFLVFYLICKYKFVDNDDVKFKNLYYYFLFLFFLSMLLIFDSKLCQIFISNDVFRVYMKLASLNLMIVPLILIISSIENYKYRLYNNIVLFSIILFNIILLFLFVIFNIKLYLFYLLSRVLFQFIIVYLTVILFLDGVVNKNNKSMMYLLLVFVIIFPILLGRVFSLDLSGHFIKQLTHVIYVGCVILFLKDPIFYMFKIFKEFNEQVVYKELAIIDLMCNVKNRNAYAIDLKNEKFNSCVVVDLNNLKYINDYFGHENGDFAIKKSSELLKIAQNEIFKEMKSELYRIGGDEFILLVDCGKEAYLKDYKNLCIELFSKENEQLEYSFNASFGLAIFQTGLDKSLEDTIKRADEEMYLMKKAVKENEKKL